MENRDHGLSLPSHAGATEVRRQIAVRMKEIDKVAVSNRLSPDDLAEYNNTEIVIHAETLAKLL